ncbi:hypothetical protein [Melghirimyces algeriensis]|uniref:Uncharacterized protein n=1 Tax=Melghirimyces algeriensis TaxID=910412 RepID=A0A521C721_9BACL|nr:hypothetical protein [Melghirimyces algeriensis]SMO54611.1 hypothetical protein SAMN06264849_103137 [Melghirimyces algeriensis]
MNALKQQTAIRWVVDRNGQVVYRDDGTAAVELRGVRGTGLCPVRALRDWEKQRRRAR